MYIIVNIVKGISTYPVTDIVDFVRFVLAN